MGLQAPVPLELRHPLLSGSNQHQHLDNKTRRPLEPQQAPEFLVSNKHSSQPLELLLPLAPQVHLRSALQAPLRSGLPQHSVLHQSQEAVVLALALPAPPAHSELPQLLRSAQHLLALHSELLHLHLEALLQDLGSLHRPLALQRPPLRRHLVKPVPLELLSLLRQDLERQLRVQVHLAHQLHLQVVALVLLLGVKPKKQTLPVQGPEARCIITQSHACLNTLKRV